MIKVSIGDADIAGFVEGLEEEIKPLVVAAADAGAEVLEAEVKRQLSRRGDPIAGQPPAFRTGELAGSIRRQPAVIRGRTVRARVRTDEEEAGRLELGGADRFGRYLPPHPYWRPAEEASRDAVEAAIDRKLQGE